MLTHYNIFASDTAWDKSEGNAMRGEALNLKLVTWGHRNKWVLEFQRKKKSLIPFTKAWGLKLNPIVISANG